MRKRDIAAVIITVIAVVFLVWFVVFGGTNPFGKYLNVKVSAGIECSPGNLYCWFDYPNVKMSYSPALSLSKTLTWWCWSQQAVESALVVENPDLSITDLGKQSKTTCTSGYLDFFWKVSLDKGAGNYKITSKTCGSTTVLGGWQCVEKTDTYYYGG